MRKIFIIFTAMFLAYTAGIQAQWSEVSPLPGNTFNDIACYKGFVYTAQGGTGVYVSSDNGATWNQQNNGITDLNVTSLLAIDGYLFAGSNSGKIFISQNNGTDWKPAGSLGSNGSQVKSIITAGGYIFAGTFSNGIYRSNDNGKTWDSTSFPAAYQVRSIVAAGTNIFAAAYDGGVYTSADNGTTWTLVNNGLTNLSLTGLSASGNDLYAGTNGVPSVFISTDKGANWKPVSGNAQFTGWGPYVQSVKAFGEKNVFAGTFLGGVYLSTDKGANWAPINDGFSGNPLVGCMATSDNNYIYIVESALGEPYNSPGGVWKRALKEVVVFPPAAPVPVKPEDKAIDQQTSLALTWNSSLSAQGYQCQVSIDSTFKTNIVKNDSALTDTVNNVDGLGNGTTYYWRVRAFNTGGFSAYSTIHSFTTIMQAPEKPALLSPANNAINRPWNDTLKCSKAAGASQYHWQVSEDVNFTKLAVNDSTISTSKVVALTGGSKYYWRVEAVNPGGTSGFSGPDSFTVMPVPSKAPVLIVPADNATFQRADTLALKWHSTDNASGYEIQISENSSFSTIVAGDSTTDTTYTAMGLKNLTKYYWRVRGFNIGGSGLFSDISSFTTIISVPAVPSPQAPTFRAVNVELKPVFSWKKAALAEKYHIQIATAANLESAGESEGAFVAANVVFDSTLADTTFRLSFDLAPSTKYYWHVRGIDTAGVSGYSNNPLYTFTTTATSGVEELKGIPDNFVLYSNYPNPFNPSTMIRYNLPKAQMVSLKIYNILGQEVATLVHMQQDAGYYSVRFDAGNLSSGIYLYILKTESFSSTHKMLLLK
jgi:hypothetical protein